MILFCFIGQGVFCLASKMNNGKLINTKKKQIFCSINPVDVNTRYTVSTQDGQVVIFKRVTKNLLQKMKFSLKEDGEPCRY